MLGNWKSCAFEQNARESRALYPNSLGKRQSTSLFSETYHGGERFSEVFFLGAILGGVEQSLDFQFGYKWLSYAS